MDDNKLRFGVGVLVVAAIGTGIILTFLFGAFPTVLKNEYELSVWFPSAEGVNTNTPVLRDGVKIGRVVDIQLQPADAKPAGGVVLTLAIEKNRQISRTYVPRIGTGSLITGESKLEFVKVDRKTLTSIYGDNLELANTTYTDEEYFRDGMKADDPFSVLFNLEGEMQSTMASIRAASDQIESAGNQVNQLAADVRTVVNRTDVSGVTNKAQSSLDEFNTAVREIRTLLNDPQLRKNITATAERLPKVLDDAQQTMQITRDTVSRVGNRYEELGKAATETVNTIERTAAGAEKTMENVEAFTEPFGRRSEEIVQLLMTTLVDLDDTLVQAEQFGKLLNQSDGTVRRLVEDDEMYYELRRTIQNVEQASAKLRPIMDDVRIFSDKIARDPRQLGVRGALTKRPTGAGFK